MGSERTDVAALSAGAIAVAVSMAVVEGPFDAMGAIVALSLVLIILSYIWNNNRTVFQSLAVGSLLGIISVPIFAFVAELILSHNAQRFIAENDPLNCLNSKGEWISCTKEEKHSSVYAIWQAGIWFLTSLAVFASDRMGQRKTQ